MFKFVGHESWRMKLPDDYFDDIYTSDDTEVLVLRSILFFYADQKTTLGKIRENFTNHAITKLEHDKFIQITYKNKDKYYKCNKCGSSITVNDKNVLCTTSAPYRTSGICGGSISVEISEEEYKETIARWETLREMKKKND